VLYTICYLQLKKNRLEMQDKVKENEISLCKASATEKCLQEEICSLKGEIRHYQEKLKLVSGQSYLSKTYV